MAEGEGPSSSDYQLEVEDQMKVLALHLDLDPCQWT